MFFPDALLDLTLWRLRGPRFFGLGHARVWVLLAILVLILVITLVNKRRGR